MDAQEELRATRRAAAKRLARGEMDRKTAREIARLLEEGRMRKAQERLFAAERHRD